MKVCGFVRDRTQSTLWFIRYTVDKLPMLYAIPKSVFSWGFEVYDGNSLLAEIDTAWLLEGGCLNFAGHTYRLHKAGILSGHFSLEQNGVEIAAAQKTALLRHFEVRYGHNRYTLCARSPLSRSFVLKQNDVIIGHIIPNHLFTRKCSIELPAAIPAPVQLFMFWLVLLMWRRTARSSAAASAN
jgi:hypothetical protein